ncbi:MAG: 16S rRNA (cytidine(1402)-2'-O)-methyltransferase [Flavobacteriales bacterium]|jgi:16S rRNA (cytidine1402-2'-O)-methyltransferase
MAGKLFLVPTPIGNLDDMTFRAVKTLQEVSLVLCEDTRVSGKLMKHFEITTPLKSFHQHNEHKLVEEMTRQLATGQSFAMISDAGSPGISDPGFLLVRECLAQGVQVESLPGATALIPALVNSGLPCDRFVFEGFLPQKKGRNKRMEALLEETKTIVFYESPYRVVKTFKLFKEFFGGERKASYSREITKLHEETFRGTVDQVIAHLEAKAAIKGEFVLILEGKQ